MSTSEGLRENLHRFPKYQAYLREHQPPTLIVWGPQDARGAPDRLERAVALPVTRVPISEMLNEFSAAEIQTDETTIFVRSRGSGPPILLLHGFPQTHLMWRSVAPLLARDFTVVCADLRGYGRSGCPPSTSDHAPYAKRAMAQEW